MKKSTRPFIESKKKSPRGALGHDTPWGPPPAIAMVEGSAGRPDVAALVAHLIEVGRQEVRDHIAREVRLQVKAAMRKASPPRAAKLLTVSDVAHELSVQQTTVRRWIREGDLRATQLGFAGQRRIYRVRRVDLDAFVEGSPSMAKSVDEQASIIVARARRRS